jgi:hypothetical protein
MTIINVLGFGPVEFPEDTPREVARDALRARFSSGEGSPLGDASPGLSAGSAVSSIVDPFKQEQREFSQRQVESQEEQAKRFPDPTQQEPGLGEVIIPGLEDTPADVAFTAQAIQQRDPLGVAIGAAGTLLPGLSAAKLGAVLPLAAKGTKKLESAPDLFKVHNITPEGLQKAKALGGLPVPSIAVARTGSGFESFGGISLVGARGSFAKDPTFAADVYSPRFPTTKNKIDKSELLSETESIKDILPKELQGFSVFSEDFLEGEGIRRIAESTENKFAFLKRKGIEISPESFARAAPDIPELSDLQDRWARAPLSLIEITKKKGFKLDAEDWLKELPDNAAEDLGWLSGGKLTDAGMEVARDSVKEAKKLIRLQRSGGGFDRAAFNRAVDEQISNFAPEYDSFVGDQQRRLIKGSLITKWDPNTATTKEFDLNLNNAVKMMKGKIRNQEGFNYGVGNIRAEVAPKLTSIKQITDRRGKIVASDQMDAVKEGFSENLESLFDRMKKKWAFDSDPSLSDFADGVAAAAKGDFTDFKNLSPDDMKQFQQFFDDLANAPTDYFEIKPQRAVSIDEFQGAAVPDGTPASVIDDLKAAGLDVETYSKGNRQLAIDTLNQRSGGDIFFSGAGLAVLYGAAKEDDKNEQSSERTGRAI